MATESAALVRRYDAAARTGRRSSTRARGRDAVAALAWPEAHRTASDTQRGVHLPIEAPRVRLLEGGVCRPTEYALKLRVDGQPDSTERQAVPAKVPRG